MTRDSALQPHEPFQKLPLLLLFSMPHPSPPATPELYSEFINLIATTSTQTLELDILPSSYPLEIHSAVPSVALPKPLLASLFLTARQVFLSHLSLQRKVRDQDEGSNKDQSSSKTKATSSNPPSYSAALDSTLVILFWDPNHLTAANFRKNHILSLRIGPSPSPTNNSVLLEALTAELHYITSLLTSPLPKHTKSSTLWSHRLFLLRTFSAEIVHVLFLKGTSTNTTRPSSVLPFIGHPTNQLHSPIAALWGCELSIILTAGERHPRNYYAWNYARQLLAILSCYDDAACETTKRAPGAPGMEMRKCLVENSVAEVQKWCFAHPRDISGWAFLSFLLRESCYDLTTPPPPPPLTNFAVAAMDNGLSKGVERAETVTANEDAARRVVAETKEFVKKFGWKGASVEWFLKTMGEFNG